MQATPLQRAEVRCSIETSRTVQPSSTIMSLLQRAEVRCSIETCVDSPHQTPFVVALQRAEVRCSIETIVAGILIAVYALGCSARKCAALLRPTFRAHGGSGALRCSARKCAALLRQGKLHRPMRGLQPVAARGSALLY